MIVSPVNTVRVFVERYTYDVEGGIGRNISGRITVVWFSSTTSFDSIIYLPAIRFFLHETSMEDIGIAVVYANIFAE